MRMLSAVITGDLAKGWLVFASAMERRRYTPLPERWAEATDEELARWCALAKPLPPPKRLIE